MKTKKKKGLVVHCLQCYKDSLQCVELNTAIQYCNDRPVVVSVGHYNRCCVLYWIPQWQPWSALSPLFTPSSQLARGVSAPRESLYPVPNSNGFHTSKVVAAESPLLNNGIRSCAIHTYMELFRFLISLLDMNDFFLFSILLCLYLLVWVSLAVVGMGHTGI